MRHIVSYRLSAVPFERYVKTDGGFVGSEMTQDPRDRAHGAVRRVRSLRFSFNEQKALEVLAFLASESPGLTPLYVAKIMFFAEKWHLNRYGRPIVADTYIAMPKGPVPSTIKNYIDQNWDWADKPAGYEEAISINSSGRLRKLMAGSRPPRREYLSESDTECLRESIAYCRNKSVDELSSATHNEKAWQSAPTNSAMDYMDFIDDDNPIRDEIVEMATESAMYGVL